MKALVEALLRPENYADRPQTVELIETHISWVILAGEHAYKVKKPVNLGFLDFSTLERRKFFCEEELRLNRRLAPELYLAVVPITGTPDAPCLGGDAAAFEYAVKMVRFDEAARLDRLAARGAVDAAQLDDFAAELAAFHARAEPASPDSAFGSPEKVRKPIFECIEGLRTCASQADAGLVDRVEQWLARELAARRDDIESRKAAGCVRECHGDLHLANLVLHRGRVLAFDCLEFDAFLRLIDVASEIAFVFMDLVHHSQSALARRLLDRWLSALGDYDSLRLVPVYLVYRALVRAKVARIRGEQEGISPEARAAAADEAASYLRFAERATQRERTYMLVMRGLSGSGKTTLASSLVEDLGVIRLRSDVERKRLFGLAPTARPDRKQTRELYSADAGQATYQRLRELARGVLEAGFPVVVDAACLKRTWRDGFRELAAAAGVPFLIVNVSAPEAVLRQRVAARTTLGSDASDATLDVLSGQIASAEPLTSDERASAIEMDAAQPFNRAAVAAAVKSRIAPA